MPDAVAPLTSEYLDLVFEMFPTAATVFGRHEHDGRLEVLTAERLDDFTRRLAELMKGRVGLDSAPGRGSMFWFELPRADA